MNTFLKLALLNNFISSLIPISIIYVAVRIFEHFKHKNRRVILHLFVNNSSCRVAPGRVLYNPTPTPLRGKIALE